MCDIYIKEIHLHLHFTGLLFWLAFYAYWRDLDKKRKTEESVNLSMCDIYIKEIHLHLHFTGLFYYSG